MSGSSSSVAQSQGSETELWFLTSTSAHDGEGSWPTPAVHTGLREQSRGKHARTLEPEKHYLNPASAAFDNVELRAGLSQPVMGKV